MLQSQSRLSNAVRPFALVAAALLASNVAGAQEIGANGLAGEKAGDQVVPFLGSQSSSIAIQVPPYHGLDPRLALVYTSEGRNGFVGTGWSLSGFSTVTRQSLGRGTPATEAEDIFLLDGQELVACGTITSPSCTAGGNYATKIESYLRVRYEASPDTWKVTAKDGTLSTLSRLATGTTGTPKWGLASVADTNGNTVTYSWACIVGEDCFPSSVSYNGATVTFFRETRPDLMSFADTNQLGDIKYRLKSVVVKLGSSAIRGYKLAYSISPVTLRSLLASVQTYGKDVAYSSTTGEITGGTSLPPQVFTYSNDALGRTFQSSTFGAATAATTEAVVWVKTTNTTPAGSTLTKTGGTDGLWDAGAISNRGIMFGDGSLDFTASVGSKHRMVGLSNGNTGVSTSDIDFALEQAPSSGLKIFGLFAFPSG